MVNNDIDIWNWPQPSDGKSEPEKFIVAIEIPLPATMEQIFDSMPAGCFVSDDALVPLRESLKQFPFMGGARQTDEQKRNRERRDPSPPA